MNRFKNKPTHEGWRAISHVFVDSEIVRHLSDKDKIDLLTRWLSVLNDIADLLRLTWEKSKFNCKEMIVQRGDDSTTWNSLAGAWNSARTNYIALAHALGMEEDLERVCFGKVMRLMAADVAAWHRLSGGTLEPDTLVWADLPSPWEVFSGDLVCTKSMVEEVCKRHGVDPVKKGWTYPRPDRKAVPFTPTPELVHGVAVSNPHLALILRKAGWFSGRPTKPVFSDQSVMVDRDEHGFALNVTEGHDQSN